jgi:hypothetical protein
MGPNAMRYSERVLAILRAGGATDRLAVLGHHLLISIVNGFTVDETGEGGQSPAGQPQPEQIARMTRDYLASLSDQRVSQPRRACRSIRNQRSGSALRDPDRPFVGGLAFRVALERGSSPSH